MNKTELVNVVAEKTGATKKDSKELVDVVFGAIQDALVEGGTDTKVTITGFGTFKNVKRKARKGRNPQSGEEIKIPAKNAVTFSVGKTLKESVE